MKKRNRKVREKVYESAISQFKRDYPGVELCDQMAYHCHLQKTYWYVEIYLRRHDPERSMAEALYRVYVGHGLLVTFVAIREI